MRLLDICSEERSRQFKCNMMQLTKKLNKIQASYTLEGTVLENVEDIKYLGVTITNALKSNISNVCTKANRPLGFLRRTFFFFLPPRRERSSLQEYGTPNSGLYNELEKVQNRAAGFVTMNYTFEEG